jgi:hypothetical protein
MISPPSRHAGLASCFVSAEKEQVAEGQRAARRVMRFGERRRPSGMAMTSADQSGNAITAG